MPAKRLKELLDSRQVRYVATSHSLAYTAQEIAASAHIPGNRLAKTVMLRKYSRPRLQSPLMPL